MILDCTDMDTPVAMIHVVGTMLYPIDSERRMAWTTWGMLKLFQSIENSFTHANEQERALIHIDLGKRFGMFANFYGGFTTLVQSIYSDYTVYSELTNNNKANIGMRAGNILEIAQKRKCSIADSARYIHTLSVSECNLDDLCISKVLDPKSEEKNTWNKYRSVSHLWAAANKHWIKPDSYRSLYDIRTLSSLFAPEERATTELCDNFYNFLISADYIRSHATCPALGACWGKKPILNPEETWNVIPPACTDNEEMVFLLKGVPF